MIQAAAHDRVGERREYLAAASDQFIGSSVILPANMR